MTFSAETQCRFMLCWFAWSALWIGISGLVGWLGSAMTLGLLLFAFGAENEVRS